MHIQTETLICPFIHYVYMVKMPFDLSRVCVANAVAIFIVSGYFALLLAGIDVPVPFENAFSLILAYLFTSSSYDKGLEKGRELVSDLRQLAQS